MKKNDYSLKFSLFFEIIFGVPQINLHLNEAYTKAADCPDHHRHTDAFRDSNLSPDGEKTGDHITSSN